MSTQYAINKLATKNMQETAIRRVLVASGLLVEISLGMHTLDGKKAPKGKLNSGAFLAMKDNHNIALDNLPNNAMLEFTVKLVKPIAYTSFKHELLAKQNESAQSFETVFTVYANLATIESSETSFLGETIDLASLHKFIAIFVKQSKDVTKISQQWRKKKGNFETNLNSAWIAYELPNKQVNKADNGETSENLNPAITEDTKQAQIEARKAAQAAKKAEKLAKQAQAKQAMQVKA